MFVDIMVGDRPLLELLPGNIMGCLRIQPQIMKVFLNHCQVEILTLYSSKANL